MDTMYCKTFRIYLFFAAVILLSACNTFPKDPEGSFDDAMANGLKVGIAEHPPFTINENGHPRGTEVTLIENFAHQNNFNVTYIVATESQLISRLEKYQLHLIAGGIEKKTVWVSKAGLSAPYDQKHVLLVPKGENKLLYKLEQYIWGLP